MDLLKGKRPRIREKRLNTLNAYFGEKNLLVEDLKNNKVKQRIRTFSEAYADEIIYILNIINSIENSAVVIHGPLGCSEVQLKFLSEGSRGRWITTNLNEKDSILGSENKLYEAINKLYKRYKPDIIFVIATPVVAINNDDILSPVKELKEELGIDIVPIFSDGFKSKNSIMGSDLVFHALVKNLEFYKEKKANFLNLITVSESKVELEEIKSVFKEMGIETNIIPRFSKVKEIKKAGEAAASISINDDEANYLNEILKDKFNISFLSGETPIGIERTSKWFLKAAEAVNLREEGKRIVYKKVDELKKYINEFQFERLGVYVDLKAAIALSVNNLLKELGLEIKGVTFDHIDALDADKLTEFDIHNDVRIHIANGQNFEKVNILNKIKPDLYIGNTKGAVLTAKLGIPAISVDKLNIIGFEGTKRFVNAIVKALQNKAFLNKLGQNEKPPYKKSWYNKNSGWYIKQEVK